MIRVTENLRKIRDLLANAAIEAGRDPATVRLLAVSKKQSLEAIREAAAQGQRDFGENYLQEGLEKIESIGSKDLAWHFIGHLQSNKTRAVAEHFDWVHTIDRLKLAERLSRQRPTDMAPLSVCLQVNVDAEATKGGTTPGALAELATAVAGLPQLRLRGLMCIPAARDDESEQRRPFALLRSLFETLAESHPDIDTLSMGMSGDYRAAILEGATIVRIGTAIFGARKDPA